MPNTSAAHQPPLLRVSSPDEMLAAVPYILGFHPTDSLVTVGLVDRRRVSFTVRMDLPQDEAHSADLAYVVERFGRERIETVLLIGYGNVQQVTAIVDRARAEFAEAAVAVVDALRVADGRYWSYLCTDPSCCPAEGKPYDAVSSRVAAEAIAAGCVALPDRATLERSIAPLEGTARKSMRQATGRAEDWIRAQLIEPHGAAGARRRAVQIGVPLVRDFLARYTEGREPLSDDEAARLGVLLTHHRVRDEAWVRIDEEHRSAHRSLWTDMVRKVEPGYVPAPASLLAVVAWQEGDGGFAGMAIQRALRADPRYSMALLLAQALDAGLSPLFARPPMSPAELESYDEAP